MLDWMSIIWTWCQALETSKRKQKTSEEALWRLAWRNPLTVASRKLWPGVPFKPKSPNLLLTCKKLLTSERNKCYVNLLWWTALKSHHVRLKILGRTNSGLVLLCRRRKISQKTSTHAIRHTTCLRLIWLRSKNSRCVECKSNRTKVMKIAHRCKFHRSSRKVLRWHPVAAWIKVVIIRMQKMERSRTMIRTM